jgi:glycosyltransferase involved in cell wall biosynthesis
MDIAVAIPTYNRAALLPATLDAVLAQTLQPTEIVVCDDGSTDDTGAVLARYASQVRGCQIPNAGPGSARAAAIAATRASWIALCDSDDLWDPTHLARLAMLAQRWPGATLLFTNFQTFGPAARDPRDKFASAPPGWWAQMIKTREDHFADLGLAPYTGFLSFQPIFPSAMMFRRELYDAVGGIWPAVSRWRAEDAHLTRRLLLRARVACDFQPTTAIRKHPGNFSAEDLKNDEAGLRILQALRQEPIVQASFLAAHEAVITRDTAALFRGYFYARQFAAAAHLAADNPALALGWRRSAARLLGPLLN